MIFKFAVRGDSPRTPLFSFYYFLTLIIQEHEEHEVESI
jgi:hypothetical protein